jgi:integrase
MAQKKLFRDAKSLIEGYELTAKRGTRKVYLIGRPLKSGNVALLRYVSRGSGSERVRERISTGVILEIETDLIIKRSNEEKVRLQRVTCDMVNSDLERSEADFAPMPKSRVRITEYIHRLGETALAETGNRHSIYATMQALENHIEVYAGNGVTFKDIDKKWLLGFIAYLRNDALNQNFLRAKDEEKRKKVGLSQNTQHRVIVNLNYVMNAALRDGLIRSNPMKELSNRDKVAAKKGTREYLSKEEVERLMNTPFTHSRYNIKEAFLFSCFTGLRYSDLKVIRKEDFHRDDLGAYLRIKMVKTREPLKIYVPGVALRLLPNKEDDGAPLFDLPKNDYANQTLRRWLKDAEITGKKITFHCGRHSAATLLLSAGLPLAVVGKQLGHLKASTTEIYAKLVDEAQRSAAAKMDELF